MLTTETNHAPSSRRRRRAATFLVASCLTIPMSLMGSSWAFAAPAPHDPVASNTKPQPLSKADLNPGGANNGGACGAYCSTRNGAPSLNGNGGGAAVGKPCAGCVGKADNKNPKGQAPNGTDANNGYECDGNNGIGKSNPAHTACVPVVPPKDCLGVVNGHATAAQCTPPRDCLGVVNGSATAAQCPPPKDCLGVVNGHATAAQCVPPRDCLGVVNGAAMATDCRTSNGVGNPNNGPLVTPVDALTQGQPVLGGPAAVPATTQGGGAAGGPGALAFTGSNAALMVEGAALLLLTGLGVLMIARKRQRFGADQ
jgi:hypothetical protein